MNMKRWQNQISQAFNFGNVTQNAEVLRSCLIPIDAGIRDASFFIEWAENTHIGSKFFIGKGTKKAAMRDLILGPFYEGAMVSHRLSGVDAVVPNLQYAQVIALPPDVTTEHRASMVFEVPNAYAVQLWEPFDLDPTGATSEWDDTTTGGGSVAIETSTVVDNGQSLQYDTDGDTNYAYMSKAIQTIQLGTGEDFYIRCFLNTEQTGSSVTTTTSSATLTSNSPIICGAINGTDYGVQLRLRGTQGSPDTYQVDFNYPKTSGIGLISGTTNLVDDKWYLLEGVVRAGTGGRQSVVLNTYLLAADGTIGAAVTEGSGVDGDMSGGRTLTTSGKWGDHDGATGKSQINFFTDQVMLFSKYTGR